MAVACSCVACADACAVQLVLRAFVLRCLSGR